MHVLIDAFGISLKGSGPKRGPARGLVKENNEEADLLTLEGASKALIGTESFQGET